MSPVWAYNVQIYNLSKVQGPYGKAGHKVMSGFFFDMKTNMLSRSDERNVTYEVTAAQLPVLEHVSLAELYLSREHIQEPHWHPNAGELDYVISGEVTIELLDPFKPQLHTHHVRAGQVVYLPRGWWHWTTCTSEDAHLLAVYSNSIPESLEGTEMLRLIPPHLFQQAYEVQSPTIHEKRNQENEADLKPVKTSSTSQAHPKQQQATKTYSVRNSSSTAAAPHASPEPAVWRPAIPGLQVRIGSTIHNT